MPLDMADANACGPAAGRYGDLAPSCPDTASALRGRGRRVLDTTNKRLFGYLLLMVCHLYTTSYVVKHSLGYRLADLIVYFVYCL